MCDAPNKHHSAEHFGESRDYWWNADFLDLMAVRWKLRDVSSLVDVGCGVGHWSQLMYPRLRPGARLVGIDRDAHWVVEAERRVRDAFPNVSRALLRFEQGDACRLPLADESVEAVTCQTVLMHLADPHMALREMLRILRPGGILICVEPDNFRNLLNYSSLTENVPVEVRMRRFEFFLRQHRGRLETGEGNHSIGELLPGYFAELGLRDIAVHLSDRAAPLFPPYSTKAQKALIAQDSEWLDSANSPWDRETLRRQVLRGGGTEAFFETAYAELIHTLRQEQQAVANGAYFSSGGGLNFLVSARKP